MAQRGLDAPVTALGGISEKYAARLARLGVRTIEDLLLLFPRRHEDFSIVTPIALVRPGEKTTIRATIYRVNAVRTPVRGMELTEAVLADSSGKLRVVWFNQPFLAKSLHAGDELFVAGKVDVNGGLVMKNPAFERPSRNLQHVARLVPIYPETQRVTSRWLRGKIHAVLPLAEQLEEFLPRELLERRRLLVRSRAVRTIHFPPDAGSLEAAKTRLAFEEMFLLQLAAQQAKRARQAESAQPIPFDESSARAFVAALPFRLTNAQRRATWHILQDMARPVPMNRLVEGEVGSGKTVVATMAIHHAAHAGFQSLLLAPTEILARQHADVIDALLRPFGMTVGLLLGSTPPGQRSPMLAALREGQLAVLVGTHALIGEAVQVKQLGLVIVDEQHRFGVAQRLAVRAKSPTAPHFLSMTATPIPRTLGLTLFGDLDISVIDELPSGRRRVPTRLVPPEKRADAYRFIREQIAQGRQVFVICPLIQESDKLGVRSATAEVEKLRTQVFPELAARIGLLHGRLKPAERDAVMAGFQGGQLAILVATSVVEVGIDIPNATVMMVEGAERFGLAQLHQFRGRVGRGTHASYCFLFTDFDDSQTLERLQALATHHSGFELAEIDLRLRGMGDLHGYRQHGMPEFKVASLLDAILIKETQEEVSRLLDRDATLEHEPALRRQLGGYREVFSLD